MFKTFAVIFLLVCVFFFFTCFTTTAAATTPIVKKKANGIKIRGNQIIDVGTGQPTALHGVNTAGMLWNCLNGDGFFDNAALNKEPIKNVDAFAAILVTSWNAKIVRISTNEDCALGINGVPAKTGGERYLNALRSYVERLVNSGLLVVIELHWNAPGAQVAKQQMPMLDADHGPAFWTALSNKFKDMSEHVLFDLYNEPFPFGNAWTSEDAAWACWRDGGAACENHLQPFPNYNASGMQLLVDTVRQTGAKNILLLGGISYANCMTKWLEYMPKDPLRSLIASTHIYPQSNKCNNELCWDLYLLPIAKQVPVFAAEIGENDCTTKAIAPLMNWLVAHKISFMGWVYDDYSNCDRGPSLTTNMTDPSACTNSYGCDFREFIRNL